MSARSPLKIRPGMNRGATELETGANWHDMNLVRAQSGHMQPVGGWEIIQGLRMGGAWGTPRAMLTWRDNVGERWIAAASSAAIAVYDSSLHDVTPLDYQVGEESGLVRGFGVGPFGAGKFGTARPVDEDTLRKAIADQVSLDNYGAWLLAMGSADGRLLRWVPDATVSRRLEPVPNAPTGRAMIATNERSILILGADGDPRRIAWCSLELPEDWLPTQDNSAGDFELRSAGPAITARRVLEGILVWCPTELHIVRYMGFPLYYDANPVGTGVGPLSVHGIIAVNGVAAWLSASGFYEWSGGLKPIPCDLLDYVQGRINLDQAWRITAYHNAGFNEYWWHYPSTDAIENDSYIMQDRDTGLWFCGDLPRAAACETSTDEHPLTMTADGQAYRHEVGYLDAGQPRLGDVWAKTGLIQQGNGDRNIVLTGAVIDTDPAGVLEVKVAGRMEANGELMDLGSYAMERADGVLDILVEARMLQLTVVARADRNWHLGTITLQTEGGAGA